MLGSHSTQIFRYAGWSAFLSAVLGILATVFMFLLYAVDVPQAIAAGGKGTYVFGTLNDITGPLQLLFMLPLTGALYRLSFERRSGLSVAAMVLGMLGLLTAVIAQTLLVVGVISFAVNLPFVLAALPLIGGWLIVANHLSRSGGSLSAKLAWLGEATGVAFVLAGGLAPVVVLAGPNGPLSDVAANFAAFAQQHPVIIIGGVILAIPIFLLWSLGLLIWLIGLGRYLLAATSVPENDTSLSHRGVLLAESRRGRNMFTRAMRWTYVVLAWIILGAVIVQFFLAGLGVFGGADGFQAHVTLGYSLLFVMLIELVLAFFAQLPWSTIGLTALLPILVVLQSVFIEIWHAGLPAVAALHVVNGLAIFSLVGFLALRSRSYVSARQSTSMELEAANAVTSRP